MADLHPWYQAAEEACREELAGVSAPSARMEIVIDYYNRDRLTHAQVLRLLDEPVSTSATENK